jgi:hypothetical protein
MVSGASLRDERLVEAHRAHEVGDPVALAARDAIEEIVGEVIEQRGGPAVGRADAGEGGADAHEDGERPAALAQHSDGAERQEAQDLLSEEGGEEGRQRRAQVRRGDRDDRANPLRVGLDLAAVERRARGGDQARVEPAGRMADEVDGAAVGGCRGADVVDDLGGAGAQRCGGGDANEVNLGREAQLGEAALEELADVGEVDELAEVDEAEEARQQVDVVDHGRGHLRRVRRCHVSRASTATAASARARLMGRERARPPCRGR